MVSIECDSNKVLAELNNLGELVGKVRNGIDYKHKQQPLVSVCKRGNTGRMSCYICIVNGNYDNALKWPFIYRVIFLLPSLTIKRANYV